MGRKFKREGIHRTAWRSNLSILKKSVLNNHWKDWCWSWSSNTLATWCEELTHWKRPWCWLRLKAGGEGDNRGWGGWMASPTHWTCIWVNSRSWWWTGRPGLLQSMGSQRVRHSWATKLNWSKISSKIFRKEAGWKSLFYKVGLDRRTKWDL